MDQNLRFWIKVLENYGLSLVAYRDILKTCWIKIHFNRDQLVVLDQGRLGGFQKCYCSFSIKVMFFFNQDCINFDPKGDHNLKKLIKIG
jgi:hypothetical protein